MITAQAAVASIVTTAGNPVRVTNGGHKGGIISNPSSADDQGIAEAATLYFDFVGGCPDPEAGGTVFALLPGESFDLPPDLSNALYVNSPASGHRFSIMVW